MKTFRLSKKMLEGAANGRHVEFSRIMDGAVSRDGVPCGRVRGTEKLRGKPDAHGGLRGSASEDPAGRLPGRPARRPAHDVNTGDPAAVHLDRHFRHAKVFAVSPQADLPGKTASGRRGMDPFLQSPPAGSHHGYPERKTGFHQVVGEVRMLQKIQDEIGMADVRQQFGGVVQNRRKGGIDGNNPEVEPGAAMGQDPPDLGFPRTLLLKYEYSLASVIHGRISPSCCAV